MRGIAGAPGVRESRRHVAGLLEPLVGALCADSRVEIDDEGDGVEGEDEGDGPFENGCGVASLHTAADAKGDDEGELDQDEGELYPEGEAKNAVFTVV